MDLHAAPGAQNHDWHSDSAGRAELWTKKVHCHKTYDLWQRLADRYKNETMIVGYDILNEAVLPDAGLLNEFYRESIKAIRCADQNHILFIEGAHWAQQIDVLDDFKDDNWVYSIHFYEPHEFTFNLAPFIRYPWDGCNMDVLRRRMEGYFRFAQNKQRPVHVGEFGVNYRQGVYRSICICKMNLNVLMISAFIGITGRIRLSRILHFRMVSIAIIPIAHGCTGWVPKPAGNAGGNVGPS